MTITREQLDQFVEYQRHKSGSDPNTLVLISIADSLMTIAEHLDVLAANALVDAHDKQITQWKSRERRENLGERR